MFGSDGNEYTFLLKGIIRQPLPSLCFVSPLRPGCGCGSVPSLFFFFFLAGNRARGLETG